MHLLAAHTYTYMYIHVTCIYRRLTSKYSTAHLPNDVRGFQLPDGEDVLGNGAIIVSLTAAVG